MSSKSNKLFLKSLKSSQKWLHCNIANNGKISWILSLRFQEINNGCVLVLSIFWILIFSHSCQHPHLLKLHLSFHKDLEMVSDKARSLNCEQWLSKSMLWKYLREVKRIKCFLDSKTVSPTYTCEYLFLNIDKMPGSSGDKEIWGQGLFCRWGRCTVVKHSHLPVSGFLGLSSQLFSRPEIEFCNIETWPNPFLWNFYLHPRVIKDSVYQDAFKHRREDCSTLVTVSQPRRTTLEFHQGIWEVCMTCHRVFPLEHPLSRLAPTLMISPLWMRPETAPQPRRQDKETVVPPHTGGNFLPWWHFP